MLSTDDIIAQELEQSQYPNAGFRQFFCCRSGVGVLPPDEDCRAMIAGLRGASVDQKEGRSAQGAPSAGEWMHGDCGSGAEAVPGRQCANWLL